MFLRSILASHLVHAIEFPRVIPLLDQMVHYGKRTNWQYDSDTNRNRQNRTDLNAALQKMVESGSDVIPKLNPKFEFLRQLKFQFESPFSKDIFVYPKLLQIIPSTNHKNT